MAEEENKGDERVENVPKAELDALRSKLDKQVAAAKKRASDAEARVAGLESKLVDDDFNVNLPEASEEGEFTPEQRSKLESGLKKGAEARRNLVMAAQYAAQQKAESLAWETAVSNGVVDDRDDILERIKEGKTVGEMENIAKTITLEYKEANIESKSKSGKEGTSEETPSRKFAEGEGRGTAANQLAKEIEQIDISDAKKAQEELDKLYAKL